MAPGHTSNNWMTYLSLTASIVFLVSILAKNMSLVFMLLTCLAGLCLVGCMIIYFFPQQVDNIVRRRPFWQRPANFLCRVISVQRFPRDSDTANVSTTAVKPPTHEELRDFFTQVIAKDLPGFEVPLYIARKELTSIIADIKTGESFHPGILKAFTVVGRPGIGKHYFADSVAHAFFLQKLPALYPIDAITKRQCRIDFNTGDYQNYDQKAALYDCLSDGFSRIISPWCYVVIEQSIGHPLASLTLKALADWIKGNSDGALPAPNSSCLVFIVIHEEDERLYPSWNVLEEQVKTIWEKGISEELFHKYSDTLDHANNEVCEAYFGEVTLATIPLRLAPRTVENIISVIWNNHTRYLMESYAHDFPGKAIAVNICGKQLIELYSNLRKVRSLRRFFEMRNSLDAVLKLFITNSPKTWPADSPPFSYETNGITLIDNTKGNLDMTQAGRNALGTALSDWNKLNNKPIDTDALIRAFKEEVFGQDHFIPQFVHLYEKHRLAMQAGVENRPLFFMLIGPPGLGKTYFCKVAAKVLFGSEKSLIDINFSQEPQNPTELQRKLFGVQSVYSAAASGTITGPLNTNPNQVVLLDEVHLTTQTLWTFFMSVTGGYLSDGFLNKQVAVTPTVFIAASNQSFETISKIDEKLQEQIKDQLEGIDDIDTEIQMRNEELLRYLIDEGVIRPEFAPRIEGTGGVFVFRPLTADAGLLGLEQAIKKTATEQKLAIKLDDGYERVIAAALSRCFENGTDPRTPIVNGRKLLQNDFKQRIAQPLISYAATHRTAGDDTFMTIYMDWDNRRQRAIIVDKTPANPDPDEEK